MIYRIGGEREKERKRERETKRERERERERTRERRENGREKARDREKSEGDRGTERVGGKPVVLSRPPTRPARSLARPTAGCVDVF